MKRSIYILGIICLSIILFGTLFKVMHFPGAAILMTVGLGTLALVFLPITYYKLLKSTDDKLLKWIFHAGFIAFSVGFIGMLFKINHWPGANWFLIIGLPLPFILFLPAYIIYHSKRKLKTNLNFFGIILFMVYLGVFSSLLSLRTGNSILNAYAISTESLSNTNQFLMSETESNNTFSSQQLVNQIESMKQSLIKTIDSENSQFIKLNGNISYHQIYKKDAKLNIQQFNDAGFNSFNKQFENFKTELMNSNDFTSRLIDEIDIYRITNKERENPIITKLPLIVVLNVLTDWQNKILLINYTLSINIENES